MTTSERKLAVGWFDNLPFRKCCEPYVSRIKEVFFAWPGVVASRPMDEWTPEKRKTIVSDLKWARENGIQLDTIFNASCYGDIAMTETLAGIVTQKLEEMASAGLFPEHLTTTSPFIATVVRQRFPEIKIRWSINMDIACTDALEYVKDLFDSFYAGRNSHRCLKYVEKMSQWAQAHGKEIGMQVNSGCLRNCPFHSFHNNLHGHGRMGQSAAAEKFHFSNFLCKTHYAKGNLTDFLKAIWIRPEDLPLYEKHISVAKLATRRHPHPDKIIAAYAKCSFDGDIAEITDPFFRFPYIIDNAALGASKWWPVVRDAPDTTLPEIEIACKKLLEDCAQPRNSSLENKSTEETFAGFFKG